MTLIWMIFWGEIDDIWMIFGWYLGEIDDIMNDVDEIDDIIGWYLGEIDDLYVCSYMRVIVVDDFWWYLGEIGMKLMI